MLAAYCATAQAALLDVGPIAPEVLGSTMASLPTIGNGFPLWYRDTTRLPLEPCLSKAVLPSGPACVLLADPGFNPALPIQFGAAGAVPSNYPIETFYFVSDAILNVGAGGGQRIKYRAALEGSFATGIFTPGGQVTFARIRIFADLPVAGTYTFTHPYGVETITAATAGARAIAFTRDIGVGTPGFTGAVAGDLGPWLINTGFPQTILTAGVAETFIGDPNVAGTITGSPFGTNFFRVDGPVGANLDGLGHNFLQTNLFTVAGKTGTSGLATPLTVDSATYTKDATNTKVEMFVTTQPLSNATTGLPPNPLALANIPSRLQFTDATATVPLTLMATNNAIDGKFFASNSFSSLLALPPTVTVTNTTDVPPSSTTVPLVDEVVISEASYNTVTSTLKVVATSGDKVALPTLTASFKDGLQAVPLGTIAGGTGTVTQTFPMTVTLPAPIGTKTYNIPPESVTVTSALGGKNTELVSNPLIQLPPLALNDTASVLAGGTVTINVAANDSTPNAGAIMNLASVLTGAPLAVPALGTITNNLNGTITYTAGAVAGTDTFAYTIKDSTGTVSLPATVTVTITAPLLPLAVNDTASVVGGGTVTINVAANDSTLNAGATMNLASVLTGAPLLVPAKGTITNNLNGTITYTQLPASLTASTDTFAYTIKDSTGTVSLPATVTVTIAAPLPPVALNDTASVATGGTVIINVAANDSTLNAGATMNLASVLTGAPLLVPTLGTITNNLNGTVTYVAGGVGGTDTFAYTIKDSTGAVSTAGIVTVTITAPLVAPTANPDPFTTLEDTAAIINVIGNDTVALGSTINPASVLVTSQPANGTAVSLGNGTVLYTPRLNYNNTGGITADTFLYTVADTLGTRSIATTVSVTVTPVPDAPLTVNDTATTPMNSLGVTINVLANDSHPDGLPSAIDPATLAIATAPPLLAGTATVVAGQVLFVPALNFSGTTSFTYIVSDNVALTPRTSLPATVTVTVTPINIAPTANNDVSSTVIGTPRIINVVANDTDPDGTINPASVIIVTGPTLGTLSAPSATGTVTYTPVTAGTDTFTYNVKDNTGAVSNNATVTVSVTSPITDSVAVLRAQYTTIGSQWLVEGSTSPAVTPAGKLVTIYLGSGLGGQIIGTVTTNPADGKWKFSATGSAVIANALNNTISVALPSGASRLAFPVAIK